MQQAEQHEVHGREQRPAPRPQQVAGGVGAVELEHHPRPLTRPRHVRGQHRQHQHRRDDDLVRGDGDDVGEQDHPVQPDEQARPVEPLDRVGGEARVAEGDVGDEPDDRAGRHREQHRAPEDDEGAVDHRRIEGLQHAGRAVRRQLEAEARRLAPQHRAREQPRGREHRRDAEHRDAHHRGGRDEPREVGGREGPDEDRRDEDLRRPAPVAQREVVGDDGDEPLAGAVDDARRHHPRRVAPEAHAHRQRLLAVGAGAAEQRVEVERHPGQVAEVFEQGEQREEDGHRRQHHRDDPRGGEVDAVEEEAAEPPGHAEGLAGAGQPRVDGVDQQGREQARRHVGPLDGQPEDHREDREHQGEPEPPARQEPVEPPVQVEAGPPEAAAHRALRDLLRGVVGPLRHRVVEVGGQVPLELPGLLQHLLAGRLRDRGRGSVFAAGVGSTPGVGVGRAAVGVGVAVAGPIVGAAVGVGAAIGVTEAVGAVGVGDLAQLARAHRGHHRAVRVEQALGHPAAVRHRRERRLDRLRQRGHRPLDGRRVPDEPERGGADLARRDPVGGVEQLVDAHPVPRRAGDHRHPQFLLQPGRVDGDAVPAGLVHQVQEHHHPVGDAQYLQHEVQVALETGGVDHHHGDVGAPEEQEVARHLLVRAPRLQRVGARQVDELDARAAVGEGALGPHDGLARPVAGVLPQAGEGVEDGALADVGVAGEGDEHVPAVGAQPEPDQALGPVLRASAEPGQEPRTAVRHHPASCGAAASGGSIQISPAWARRSAIRAPRMR